MGTRADSAASYLDPDVFNRRAEFAHVSSFMFSKYFANLFSFTLRDFKEGSASPGRQSTRTVSANTRSGERERVLRDYCDYFRRVFRGGFGDDNKVSATIFTEDGGEVLPVRLVAIHLGSGAGTRTGLEEMDSLKLIERLKRLDERFLKLVSDPENGGIFYRRVARIYNTMRIEGKDVPTIFIVKPDQVRYWTRSMALRDADEIAGTTSVFGNVSTTRTSKYDIVFKSDNKLLQPTDAEPEKQPVFGLH